VGGGIVRSKIIKYRCYGCDHIGQVAISGEQRWNSKCDKCGREVKNYKSTSVNSPNRRCYVDVLMDDNPRWSDALGINPAQAEHFKKRFPHLNLEFNSEGQCLVRNRHHKKQILKARGYYD
jgi:hypothetical protein